MNYRISAADWWWAVYVLIGLEVALTLYDRGWSNSAAFGGGALWPVLFGRVLAEQAVNYI